MAGSAMSEPTIDDFEAVLRRHDSATLALEEWCAAQGLSPAPKITAQSLEPDDRKPPEDMHHHLQLAPGESPAMRKVRLSCGQTVLSVAWNWYVPSRLTPQMKETLHTSDAPFGKVAAPLRFRRKPLETLRGRAENCPEGTISTHRAILVLPDGRPLAYLIECYTAANLTAIRAKD